MRVWDLPVDRLCKKHLLGEHRELHAIFSVLANGKKGYSQHPETKRWKGKLAALRKRHEEEVAEMHKRGWKHNSPLPATNDVEKQDELLHTLEQQEEILRGKNCQCNTKVIK